MKISTIFVSYKHREGWGNATIISDYKLNSKTIVEDLKDITKIIEDKANGKDICIINYKKVDEV